MTGYSERVAEALVRKDDTVAEMIEVLSVLPQDAPITYGEGVASESGDFEGLHFLVTRREGKLNTTVDLFQGW